VKLADIKDPTFAQHSAVTKGHTKLWQDIIQWREYQFKHFPQLCDHCPPVDFSTPEVESLSLPLAFTPAMHTSLNLENLATIEYDLQEGQAHDALHGIQEAIKHSTTTWHSRRSIYMARAQILMRRHS
jgi:hypothetical protein